MLSLISNGCPDLQETYATRYDGITITEITALVTGCKQIVDISLLHCFTDDCVAIVVQNCHQIRNLSLEDSDNMTDAALRKTSIITNSKNFAHTTTGSSNNNSYSSSNSNSYRVGPH